MKQISNFDESIIPVVEEQNPEMRCFKVCGCWILMNPLDKIMMVDKQSQRTWKVLLQKEEKSTIFIDLLFDECPDMKNKDKHILNKSKKGNPYYGLLYSPGSRVNDKAAFEEWKKNAKPFKFRYSRAVDCCRFAAGLFENCGLTMEDFTEGRAKYDDVYAWLKGHIIGKPLEEPCVLEENTKPNDPWEAFGFQEYEEKKDDSVPWFLDEETSEGLPF